MDAEIRGQVMEHYRLQREKNAREERRRKDEVCARDPRIAEQIALRHEMILRGIKSAFKQVPNGDLEGMMLEYNRKIRALLQENGFPENYLEPVYECAQCRDTGYVGEPLRKECACLRRRIADARDGITERSQTFERFDDAVFPELPVGEGQPTQRELMAAVRVICEKYADDFPGQHPGDLYIYGSSGLGKTYLLSCIAKRVRARGYEALGVTAYAAQAALRAAYFSGSNDGASLMDAELLLIDDLGMEPLMENTTAVQFYNLLNERRKRGLSTVISSNLTMSDVKNRYTERVSSRLLDADACRVIHLLGRDVRLMRKG